MGDGPRKVRDLSALMSVFVGETSLLTYAPHGASGCYSSLVYMNPGLALRLHELCASGDYARARLIHDDFDRLIGTGLAPFRDQGYVDTTYDRLMGMVTGFLGPDYHRVRDPYPSTQSRSRPRAPRLDGRAHAGAPAVGLNRAPMHIDFAGRTVIVTGGTGALGGSVVRAFWTRVRGCSSPTW